jgi:hypothetical protein
MKTYIDTKTTINDVPRISRMARNPSHVLFLFFIFFKPRFDWSLRCFGVCNHATWFGMGNLTTVILLKLNSGLCRVLHQYIQIDIVYIYIYNNIIIHLYMYILHYCYVGMIFYICKCTHIYLYVCLFIHVSVYTNIYVLLTPSPRSLFNK